MAEYHHFPIYAKEAKDIPDWMKTTQYWQNAVPLDKLQKHQLKVKMCCPKCEEKVVEEIREVHGVFDVRGERFNSKVVVVSMPPPNSLNEHEVLRRARKVDKMAKFVELDAKERPKTEEQKKKEAEEAKKKKEAEDKKKKEEDAAKKQQEAWKKEQEAWRKEHEAALANVFTWKQPPVGHYPPQDRYYPGEFFFREFTARLEEERIKKAKEAEEEEKKKKKAEEEEKKKKQQQQEAEELKKKELEAMAMAANMWNPNWNGPYYPPQPYPYNYADNSTRPSQWYAPRSFHPPPPPPFQRERDEFSRPYFYY